MHSAPVVIVMTSNGVGMGHLSRQLATVLSAGERMRAVVLSLSGALPRVAAAAEHGELPEAEGLGLRFEYCPSWESPWLTVPGRPAFVDRVQRNTRWAAYLRDRIVALARETGASALVFDGVAPYRGLLAARKQLPSVRFAWVRRGMWHPSAPPRRLEASRHFDLTIAPRDIAEAFDRGPTVGRSDASPVAPVSLTSALHLTDRAHARATLGLPAEGPVLLLAPGAGVLRPVEAVVAEVLERTAGSGWHVALTRQAIARHAGAAEAEHVTVLDDVYPLARHLAAFDASIGAAGYNAVHELSAARVPSIFLPNPRTTTDDQLARGAGLESMGVALVSDGSDLGRAVECLLDESERARLREAMGSLPAPEGSAQAAELVLDLASEGAPDVAPLVPRTPPPSPVRLPRGGALSEQVDGRVVRGSEPVEHVLAGASEEYREVRRRAARWVFRTPR